MPDEALLRKYTRELDRLERDKHLTPNELYFMKTDRIAREYLVQKTFNDEDNFYDKLPEEILNEIKSLIEKESLVKYDEEKFKHLETQSVLDNTKIDLNNRNLEVESIRAKNILYENKISNFSSSLAKWLIKIVFGLVLPVIIIAFAVDSFPDRLNNKFLSSISIIVVCALSLLSAVFGFSVKGFFKRIETWLKIYIRNIILK